MSFYKFTGSAAEFFPSIGLTAQPGYVYDFGSATPPNEPILIDAANGVPSKWASDTGPATDFRLSSAQASDLLDQGNVEFNVKAAAFGGKCNAKVLAVSITAGSNQLSKTTGSFNAGDVGKVVVVPGAGVSRTFNDGAITNGQTALTSAAGASFLSSDVRSVVTVAGAGTAGAALVTTLSKVSNSTTASTLVAASTTVSGATVTLASYLSTTILSVSNGVATLATTAGTTVSAVSALVGTDDTAAIAAAHAAAAVAGGVVRIPGNCVVTAGLTPANHVEIRGTRSGAATVYMASLTNTPFAFLKGTYSTVAPLTNFKLADLTIDGLYMQTVFNVGNKGTFLQYLSACVFENLVIQNTLATGLGDDYLANGTVVHNVKAFNCGAGSWAGVQGGGSAGIGIGTGGFTTEQFTVSDCYASGNGTFGIFIEGQGGTTTPGMRIVNCSASGNHLSGFCDAGGSGAQWVNCWSYNNDLDGFTNASGTLVSSVPGNDTVWANCVAYNNLRYGFSYYPFRAGNSSNFQPNANARVTWSDCKAISNTNQGFYVQTNTANTIDGLTYNNCEAYLNGSTGLILTNTGTAKNVRVSGGAYYNNGQTSGTDHFGIRVNCTADTINISGVRCYDSTSKQTHGLALSSTFTITNLVVQNCDLRGNSTAALSTGATLAGTLAFRDVVGFNPVGSSVPGTAFALPASTVAWTNTTGVDGTLYVTAAGTVTVVTANGVAVGTSLAVGQQYRVKAGGTFTLTYSVAPTLVFVGD